MKSGKRIFCLGVFLAMLLGCLLMHVSAAEVIDFGYCGGEGDGTNLSWTLTEDNTLTITGNGKMADYGGYGAPWVNNGVNKIYVVSVSIGDGVTTIGSGAFRRCKYLKTIEIPNTVTQIGDSAFGECSGITRIELPNSITTIDSRAFSGCDKLTDIVLPDSILSMGEGVFVGCDKLTKVILPKKLTVISENMFDACAKLKTVEISDNITNIEGGAFYGCVALENIQLPPKVTTIAGSAFGGCKSLSAITLPDSVTTIGGSAFNGCSSLLEVTVPGSVTTINFATFKDCSGLREVTVAEGVKYIDSDAFENCSALTEVSLPDSLISIEIDAFNNCESLNEIVIPASVKKINGGAFINCTDLTAVFFEGNAPHEIGWQEGFESFPKTVTFYYIPGMTGWTDSDAYDAEAGTWNGYKLAVWEGRGEEPEDKTAKVVSLFPEDKAAGFGTVSKANQKISIDEMSVTFNKELKTRDASGVYAALDFSKGSIAVYRMDDDQLIWDAAASGEASVELLVDDTQKKLLIRPYNRYAFLDFDSVYYVVMDAGVVQFADGSIGPAIQKGDWTFRTAELIKACRLEELTDIDYLAFSSLVYEDLTDGKTVKELLGNVWNKSWEGTDIKYSELYDHIQDWTVLKHDVNNKTGFYAAAFANEDGEAVIAYRGSIPFGTWGEDWEDAWNDWVKNDLYMMFLNAETEKSQYSDAMEFYKAVAEGRTKEKIAVTGHSLGGAWADIISAYSGCKGCSFNAINVMDVFYGAHPVAMAESFKGINRWAFHDHINEHDTFAGKMEYAMKPHYLHESLYDWGTFDNHGLKSIIYKHNGQLFLTYAERYETAAEEWLSVNLADTASTFVKMCFGNMQLRDAASIDGINLDMGTNQNDQFMSFFSSDAPWEHITDLLYARVSYGGSGDDWLFGFLRSDILVGGPDDDILDGMRGDDVYIYYKGQGVDTFVDIRGEDRICLYGLERSDVIHVRDDTDSHFILICCNGEPMIKINKTIRHTNNKGECDPIILELHCDNNTKTVDITSYLVPTVSYLDPIIISCPVDIQIIDQNGKVVHTVRNAEPGAFYTDFGNFYVYEEEDGEYGKYLDLVEGYDIRIVGVGEGSMDVMVYEAEENAAHTAEGVAVTDTMAAVLLKNKDIWSVSVDEDGDGSADEKIPMDETRGENPSNKYPTGGSRPSVGNTQQETVAEKEAFRDVTLSDWFYDEVRYAYENNLMKGVGNGMFAPNAPITRAMMVTILHRLEGESVAQPGAFTDVPIDAWYADAVGWATENSIVKGYGNGIFAPNDAITREQLATVLYRYAQYKGDTPKGNDLPSFVDVGQVSPWAKEAVGWTCREGLLNGMGDGRFAPGSELTRAQMAAILLRLCENK